MSRVDTTSFANLLMGGLRTGINLGESANQQAFQQQQFAANEQQRGFANSLALQDQSMRAQALDMQVQDRLRRWQEEDDQRTANDVLLKSMMADDATFEAGVQSLLPHIGKASPDVQRGLLNRKQYLDEYKRDAAKLDSFRNSGGKLSEEEANYYRKKGHILPREILSKTAREDADQKEQQDKEAMVVSALQSGLVGQNEVPALMKYASTKALSWDLGARRYMKQQQEKAALAQQADMQKQQAAQQIADTNYQNARAAGVKAGVNPAQLDARIAADRAGFTLGENAFGGESDSAARAGLNQRIQAAKASYELALKELEPLAAAVKADPVTGKVANSVSGEGWTSFRDSNADEIIPKYEAARAKADQARRTYEALNQQAIGGGAIQADPIQKKRERAMQLKAQGVPLEQARSILLQEFGE